MTRRCPLRRALGVTLELLVSAPTWPFRAWRWLEEPIPDENDWSLL